MRSLVVMVLCLLFSASASWAAEQETLNRIKVFYLEFPPYYYTNSNQEPAGFLLKKTEEIFRRAGIEATYESGVAKYVLQDMRALAATASIGWFKTPEREVFAKFSQPIYQNKPMQVLYLKKNDALFDSKETVAQLMADKSLTLGVVAGYSFGSKVDNLIKKHAPATKLVTGGYPHLMRMLVEEQFSYMLVAPEEIASLVKMNYLVEGVFKARQMADIPAGNRRYLIFSKSVPGAVIRRVNKAIESF